MKLPLNKYSSCYGIFSNAYVVAGIKYTTSFQQYPGNFYIGAAYSNALTSPYYKTYHMRSSDRLINNNANYMAMQEKNSSDYILINEYDYNYSQHVQTFLRVPSTLDSQTTLYSYNMYPGSFCYDYLATDHGILCVTQHASSASNTNYYCMPNSNYNLGLGLKVLVENQFNSLWYITPQTNNNSSYTGNTCQEYRRLFSDENMLMYSVEGNVQVSSKGNNINYNFKTTDIAYNDVFIGKTYWDSETNNFSTEWLPNITKTSSDIWDTKTSTSSSGIYRFRNKTTGGKVINNKKKLLTCRLDTDHNQQFYAIEVHDVEKTLLHSHTGSNEFVDDEHVINHISLSDGNFQTGTDCFCSGSKSYNVSSGKSFGYIEIEFDFPTLFTVESKTTSYSSYYGYIALSSEPKQPSLSDVSSKTKNTTNCVIDYIYTGSGNQTNYQTNSYVIPPGKYYVVFGYSKSGSRNDYGDRFYVKGFKFTTYSYFESKLCTVVGDKLPLGTIVASSSSEAKYHNYYVPELMQIGNNYYLNVLVDFSEDQTKSGVYTYSYDPSTETLEFLDKFVASNNNGINLLNFMPFEERFLVCSHNNGHTIIEFMEDTHTWRIVKQSPIIVFSMMYDSEHRQLCYNSITAPYTGMYFDPIYMGLCGDVHFTDTSIVWEGEEVDTTISLSCKNFYGEYVEQTVYLKLEGNCKFKSNNSKELTIQSFSSGAITIPVVITGDGVNKVYANLVHVES